jgi:SAM-dependent methyltransferase
LSALRYLKSDRGKALLLEASTAIQQGLNTQIRLRNNHPAEFCRAALYLGELRMRALEKFPNASEMFFDRDGYEMATRADVAAYRAQRLSHCDEILDLCCGIGGDSMFLAQKAKVTAIDLSRTRIEMARFNCNLQKGSDVVFAVGDANYFATRTSAIFIDPARRKGGRRTRRGQLYNPPISIADRLRKLSPNIIIKVSPAIPEEELPTDAEIEFVSSGRQCREGLIYWGPTATAHRRATVLPGPHTLTDDAKGESCIDSPGTYLYDPDPAVVRAHLIDELARKIDAWKLDSKIAYLTNNHPIKTPFAKCYRILDVRPFGVKTLRKHLRQQGYFPSEIKRRRFPMEPSEIKRSLEVSTGDKPVVLVLSRISGKMTCLICENIGI